MSESNKKTDFLKALLEQFPHLYDRINTHLTYQETSNLAVAYGCSKDRVALWKTITAPCSDLTRDHRTEYRYSTLIGAILTHEDQFINWCFDSIKPLPDSNDILGDQPGIQRHRGQRPQVKVIERHGPERLALRIRDIIMVNIRHFPYSEGLITTFFYKLEVGDFLGDPEPPRTRNGSHKSIKMTAPTKRPPRYMYCSTFYTGDHFRCYNRATKQNVLRRSFRKIELPRILHDVVLSNPPEPLFKLLCEKLFVPQLTTGERYAQIASISDRLTPKMFDRLTQHDIIDANNQYTIKKLCNLVLFHGNEALALYIMDKTKTTPTSKLVANACFANCFTFAKKYIGNDDIKVPQHCFELHFDMRNTKYVTGLFWLLDNAPLSAFNPGSGGSLLLFNSVSRYRLSCPMVVRRLLQHPQVDPTAHENRVIKAAFNNRHSKSFKVLLKDGRADPNAISVEEFRNKPLDWPQVRAFRRDPRFDSTKYGMSRLPPLSKEEEEQEEDDKSQ